MADQVLTVRCKLSPSDIQAKSIGDTLIAFADACTWINQNVDPRTQNQKEAIKIGVKI